MDLSVIIPFINEEENLVQLNDELTRVLGKLNITSEVIYIDDGSTDSSYDTIKKEIEKSKVNKVSFTLIRFIKNLGQTAAISAGIDNSGGKLISFLDADLQNDPNDIPRFLEKLDEGFDAVFGWRKDRKDATLRSLLSRLANLLINKIFDYPYHDVGCSARVVKKEFVTNLQLYGELHRVMPVLIYLKGAKVGEIVVSHRNRFKGKSKYGYKRIVKTMIDLITVKFLSSYGTRPAYIFGSFGFGSLIIGSLTLLASLYKKLFLGVYIHNDPFFMIAIFFGLLGVQFILMGLMAELQVRTYFESQKKPIYEIKDVIKE
ncbi:hypothetical protein A3A76_03855 [Candidatus Woesebacteria bacterium RIFCSPLOWO2_01_FULL_39_23]|uniref:Glycosyltransferase 2-like domain-containing protein n=1 Tax=Candidatus Woesebacteria bacterium RIFCSPHIGHO2_01_FULL_40_22 TaxID=1802499 RepID=A0A1F7YLW5_9BACT|nr:MAG: hypothetical protein A2141_00160 [Candidatus Woesebacteria bacterium RBG_16_40_11]OGM27588.1 MAG: hypothetical protein A2628_02255 [Candidatus Woesebacteria bacterium RIFCSPHIGHO2_01_FULL_40_22]OGM36742.1 MAG: hypothetical protein A3E41_03100 [Candidatus Woesebacteria bacterium RIFCSPHIGHO2_12_FULL_38_9]OGM62762.1 MAG: hypothetical protein A3A76_03855 [Candidatus Woesebacteria bacterium RIFCSPLOWO2_01_FULL_39_23]